MLAKIQRSGTSHALVPSVKWPLWKTSAVGKNKTKKKKQCSKHNTYLRSQQFHSWAFIPGRWELLFAQKPVRGVRSSFNSQKLGIQMPFSGWAAKQTVVHQAVDQRPGTKRSWPWGHVVRTDLRGIRLSEENWSWNIPHNVLKMTKWRTA